MVEYDIWKREEGLENTKKVIVKFNGMLNTEMRQ